MKSEEEFKNESPFSKENLESLKHKPSGFLTKFLAYLRIVLFIASPFIAYHIDNPSGFFGWLIFLFTWGLLIAAINFIIGMISAALIKHL